MKQINYSTGLIAIVLCLMAFLSQALDKTEKGTIKIDLAYHQLNNDLPIIKLSAKTKKDKKFQPVEGVFINLFLNTEASQGFMGRVETNINGAGSLHLPVRFKDQWDSLASFTFIGTLTGSDSFENLAKWKNYEYILEHCPIYVYRRPGHEVINNFKQANIVVMDAPLLQISATHIRNNIKQSKSIRYLLPDKVIEEIERNGFYR